jgi:hypothetical protein
MLVCNVSLRPPRRAIAAELAEVVTAADATATGNVVFATLIDDPASVRDNVDAYLGEIMLEAASAADTVSFSAVIDAAVVEALTAADAQDGATTISTITWDAATVTAVTLSAGDLVATNTGTTSTSQGARGATTAGKTTGKYYFEVTWSAINQSGGNYGIGIGTTASTYANMGNGGTTGDVCYRGGSVWSNGASISVGSGAWTVGQVAGVAVDLTNRRIWFRLSPSGVWNGNGANNPATNVGGFVIPAGTMVPFCTFGGTGGVANNVLTANFGASAFTGAVPSGYTAGWPP